MFFQPSRRASPLSFCLLSLLQITQLPTEPRRPLTLFTTPIAFSKTRAPHACSPLGPHHTNRPALLRCYINRLTSPLLLLSFLGPPNGRRLMSTRNSGPTFSSSKPKAAPKKHLLQHTGAPVRSVTITLSATRAQQQVCTSARNTPSHRYGEQGVPQKTARVKPTMCACLGK